MKFISKTFLGVWTLLCILFYFDTCDGGGMIAVTPTFWKDFDGDNYMGSYNITLNGTDGEAVSFGSELFSFNNFAGNYYDFQRNFTFSTSTPFHSINRNFSLHAYITKTAAVDYGLTRGTRHFYGYVDFIRDGKMRSVNITNGNATLTVLYRMTCDPYSKGPLCEICRVEVQHRRYNCVENGTRKVCRKGYANPAKECNKKTNHCDPNPCFNGSQCISLSGKDGYKCECSVFFEGKNCSVDVNECKEYSPCQNGGICKNTLGGYKCQCTPAFQGKNCSDDVNECKEYSPCQNGGICTNYVGWYDCDCKVGYMGVRCADDVNECATYSPCQNGGTCKNIFGSYECQCKAGFQGINCTDDVNECTKYTPCRNGGTCNNTYGGYKCYCPDKYGGENCTKEVVVRIEHVAKVGEEGDVCLVKAPCKNGGTCTTSGTGYKCSCKAEFEGKDCSKDVDECLQKPCKHKAPCINLHGDYKCYCRGPYLGKNCNKMATLCVTDSPCMNGGKCFMMVTSGYRCQCPPVFEGINCTEDVDECEKFHPCMNNGRCQNTIGSFKCSCRPKYFGQVCQYKESNCRREACLNEGTCSQIDGRFFCKCKNTVTGDKCNEDYDACKFGINKSICMNNGTCKNTAEGVACDCPTSYEGKYCQFDRFHKNTGGFEGHSVMRWTTSAISLIILICIVAVVILWSVIWVVLECWSKEDVEEVAEEEEKKRYRMKKERMRKKMRHRHNN